MASPNGGRREGDSQSEAIVVDATPTPEPEPGGATVRGAGRDSHDELAPHHSSQYVTSKTHSTVFRWNHNP